MYKIYAGSEVVGQAEVIKEGLYYRFSCKCTPPNDSVHRIMVSDGINTRDLGICVPTGEWFCLVSRIPVKSLPGEKLEFALVPRDGQIYAIAVVENGSFPALDLLESAHFQERNGHAEIVIDPAPVPQDSDQSLESPHKWE